MIRLESNGNGYIVRYKENGIKLGEILPKEDGYFDFWPDLNGGYWPSYMLRTIADKIDELNKPWNDEVNKYFEEHN